MRRGAPKMHRFIAGLVTLLSLVAALPLQAEQKTVHEALIVGSVDPGRPSFPTERGLPVLVRTAMVFQDVRSFDEQSGEFEAVVDLRLTWVDPRLAYTPQPGDRGYHEFKATEAEAEIAKIWTPKVRYLNLTSEPGAVERRLRIFADGTVETIARITGTFASPVSVEKFPFDHQKLAVETAIFEDIREFVNFDFVSNDLQFSKAANAVSIDGWTTGHVNLERGLVRGWNGDRYSKVTIALDIQRQSWGSIAVIFIPLFSSLLIPFLAVWMNSARGGEFEIEAFELGNVVVGGLFAVIALGVTFSSAYPSLVAEDNTVSRLLSLNYLALGVGVLIIVFLYRFKLVARWFGPYVQNELYRILTWAFPALFITAALAVLAIAAV